MRSPRMTEFLVIGSGPVLLLAMECLLGEREMPLDTDSASVRRHSWAVLRAAMDRAELPKPSLEYLKSLPFYAPTAEGPKSR
jgi:hypothetical protein